MSLWQKVKGMSKKARTIAISIALALVLALGGLATGLSLSNKNGDRIGSDVTAESSAMGTNMTKTAPSTLGNAANAAYKYTPYNASTNVRSAFTQIPAAQVNGAYFIDTPGKWLYVIDQMNAKNATFLNARYIFAGGTMDFGGQTISPAATTSANPFTGTIYGNKTTIQNVTIKGVKDTVSNLTVKTAQQTYTQGLSNTVEFCGLINFARGASFYDLALNNSVNMSTTLNVNHIVGGFVAYSVGVAGSNNTLTFINCGSFINPTWKHTKAGQASPTSAANCNVCAAIGGFVGIGHAGTSTSNAVNLYFNGCAYSGTINFTGGTLLADQTLGSDNTLSFGGFFGRLWPYSKLDVHNCASDMSLYLTNTGPNGGAYGTMDNSNPITIKADNIVSKIYMESVSGVNSPDYGCFVNTWCGNANSYCTTDSYFTNMYIYGSMKGSGGGNYDCWINAKNASGKSACTGIHTSIDLAGIAADMKTSPEYDKVANDQSVIDKANGNSGIKNGGTVVNEDGTVGSSNLPEGTFDIEYHDEVNTSAVGSAYLKYNSQSNTTLPTRTQAGATFNGWSVGSWTSTPVMTFTAGGRIGKQDLYARWTLADSGTTKSVKEGATQTITYGTNATFTATLTHPLVTAGKAQINIDGWYIGSSYGTKLFGASGTGTGANSNIVATTSGNTYTLTFTKPTVAQSMTYRLKYTLAVKAGVNGLANSTGYYDITLKVNKATVTNPTFTTEFTYDTDSHNVVKTAGTSTLYTAGGTTSATDAGSYTATFTLTDAANYKWATTSGLQAGVTLASESGVLTVKWTIKQVTFNEPSSDPSNPDKPDNPPAAPGYKPWVGQGEDPDAPEYDPRLDPSKPQYDPKLDPKNPSYDPTIDPTSPEYDPDKDPYNPYGDSYDPEKDPRRDPESGVYDPRLDPSKPQYDPRLDPDPKNPDYDPTIDPASPEYDPDKDPYNPYGDNYDPEKDPRKDPESSHYDPKLDPNSPEYDPKIDPSNPGYIPELDPHNPDSPAYDGDNATGSYVKFEIIGTGIVGLTLNNPKNNGGKGLEVTGSAWITYANGKKQVVPGTFSFKNPGEYISYDFFNYTYALSNKNQSIYMTIVVFTPNDKSISPYEREVAIVVIGQYIDIAETKVDEATGSALSSANGPKVWLDYGSIMTIAPQIGGGKIVITYYDGNAQKTTQMTGAQTPVGFTATLAYRDGGQGSLIGITGVNNVFTLDFGTSAGTTYYGQIFYVSYTPAHNTPFTVYYVLETTGRIDDGKVEYPYSSSSSVGSLDSDAGSTDPRVYKATATGTTTKPVYYMENGQYLTTTVNMGTLTDHYELDTSANRYLDEMYIKGDGSTYAVVFLKAKYHTVTFLAVGAVEHSMQTQQVKYNGKVDPAKVETPKKNGANFAAWYDEQTGGNVVTLVNVTVIEDVTYYAHFDNTYYYIVFDMNAFMGGVDDPLPDTGAINLNVIPRETEVGSLRDIATLIKWNYSSLFGSYGADDFFFATTNDDVKNGSRWKVGDYVFRYTVDSLTKNLSLTSSAVKPSALAYTFVNWYTTDASGKITTTTNTTIRAPKNYASGTSPDAVITIKASWKVQTYTLVFDKQDGSRTTTVSGVSNLSTWDTIFNKNNTLHPDNVERTGYTFVGWYATPECDGNEVTTNLGTPNYFSVYDYLEVENADGGYIYKTENPDGSYTYNLSTIRLYAKWENVKITADIQNEGVTGGQISLVSSADPEGIYLDQDVTVTVEVDHGHKFSYLIVGKTPRYIYSNGTDSLTFTVYGSDVDFTDEKNPKLTLKAVFDEVTYTISYNMDGGTSYESRVNRSYTRSNLERGDLELPNLLRKKGYNFLGWKFTNTNPSIDGQWAFNNTYQSGEDLYDKDIYLTTKVQGSDFYYGDIVLIAVWSPKEAVVKLHNVSYNNVYDKDAETESYYEVVTAADGRTHLVTGDTVTIINPESESFEFIGWATTRYGEVVYPANMEDGELMNVVYTVKSDYALDGSVDPTANHLYAVWKVQDFDYVVITAEGNGNVYNGSGITLNAITSKTYTEDSSVGSSLTITYTWYRINDDGDYSAIFRIKERIYIDSYGVEVATATYTNGEESSWKWASGHAGGDGITLPDEGEYTSKEEYVRKTFAYVEDKELIQSALGTNAAMAGKPVTVAGDDLTNTVSYTVPNVAMAGRYICVAEVTGSTEGAGIVRYGEITVTMPRAEFRGVVFQSKSITYDGLGHSIYVDLTGNDKDVTMSGNTIYLPDKDNKGNDNKAQVNVTYAYKLKSFSQVIMGSDGYKYDAVGNYVNDLGQVVTTPNGSELAQEVVNAGLYTVTASFRVEQYENHSYDVIESISAELEVGKRKLTNVTLSVEHDVEGWTDSGLFTETYDGTGYAIVASINDKDLSGSPLIDVANGLISLEVKVYKTVDGINKGDLVEGNPVNAGKYIAEINKTVQAGEFGDNSRNYIVGDITTLQTFVIEKARLDYGLSFKDAEVTFDNSVHTIQVMSNNGKDALPEMLTATYKQTVTFNEDVSKYYDVDNKCLENDKYYPDYDDGKSGTVKGNGGRHAGVYEISVALSFVNEELGKNYEPLTLEPATLTIKKADLIDFYDDGDETNGHAELFGSDFRDMQYSYIVNANQMKYVSSSTLDAKDGSGTAHFITYYTVSRQMENGSYVAIYTGTREEIEKTVNINAPGTYKIDAEIVYNTPVYKNNFENIDVQTIYITIGDSVIEDVEIFFTEAAYKDGVSKMVQYIGETFNISYLEKIVVTYEGGVNNTLTLTGVDLDPANGMVSIIYDTAEQETAFWHVGERVSLTFELFNSFKKKAAATIKILQKIDDHENDVDFMYSVNGVDYKHVPEDGLNLEEIGASASVYTYRLYFNAIDENGGTARNLYVDVTIDPTSLVRGENALNIGTVGLYDFSEIEVTLNAYVLIDFNDAQWKYSTDGREWSVLGEDASLPYIAKTYYVGVAFMGQDGNEIVAILIPNTGNVLNAGQYDMVASELYTNDPELYEINNRFYRINNVNLGIPLTVAQHELKLTWDEVTLKYTGEAQKVYLTGADILDADVNDIVLEYSYYKTSKNADGSIAETLITDDLIVNAGDYRIRVTGITVADGVDAVKAGNYSIPEDDYVDFTINKASIAFERVYYLESGVNYGYDENTSYQNNPQGLRTDKIRYSFGSNKVVEGDFYFVVRDIDNDTYQILSDVEAGAQYLQTASTRQVMYMYSPLDMRNYDVLVGTITINVKAQTRTNSLRVVRKTGAAPFYIVDSVVGPDRFEVYETYASFYVENGVEYGKCEPLTTYRVEANGSLITDQYKYKVKSTDSKVVITVYHSSNSNINGTLEFAVYQSQPKALVLSEYEIENKIKKDWYVGEVFTLPVDGPNAVVFKLLFENGDDAELSFLEMIYTVSGVGFNERDSKFTSPGVALITFSYAGFSCELELVIKPKEELTITTPQTRTVKYEEGKEQSIPELEFSIKEGDTFKSVKKEDLEGVDYKTEIMKLDGSNEYTSVEKIIEEGTYVIFYYFQITNPRFETPDPFRLTVNVKAIVFIVDFAEFDEAELTSVYTGNVIQAPLAKVKKITDDSTKKEYTNGWTVEIDSIKRLGVESEIVDAGDYTIISKVYFQGEEIDKKEYDYTVTQAENSATITVKNVLVGEEVGYGKNFDVTNIKYGGPFDEGTMITYSNNTRNGFTTTAPTEVGVWYVKLEIQGTSNYATLTIIEKFNINYKSLASGKDEAGDVWVDVEGGSKGLNPGTILEVAKVEQAELDSLKIKNNRVYEGYDVSLVDSTNGEPVTLTEAITIKLLISEEYRGISKLSVRFVTVDANGKTKTEEIKNFEISEDGKYIVFSVSSVGRFVITEKLNTVPVGLLVGVIVCAVIAAGLIVACVLVFLKKREII